MTVKILGAGLAGLSCAINLGKKEREVLVYERRSDVGRQIKPNLQGVGLGEDRVKESFRRLNISPPKHTKKIHKILLLTPKRDVDFVLPQPYNYVVRGGKQSLEYSMYGEALKHGVDFVFNSRLTEKGADVVATGPKKVDCVAVGGVYENTSFPEDTALIMFDDRFSPDGWYFYMIPYSKDLVEAVNCIPKPHTQNARKLFENALTKRPLIKKFMTGSRLVYSFSGYGNAFIPKKAEINGRLYVGEACGFQDPFMGFGIEYALQSGYLAATALSDGLDYERMWRNTILPKMKRDIAKRFVLSLFGSRIVEFAYRNHKPGQITDLTTPNIPSPAGKLIEELFYQLEWTKKRFLGYW